MVLALFHPEESDSSCRTSLTLLVPVNIMPLYVLSVPMIEQTMTSTIGPAPFAERSGFRVYLNRSLSMHATSSHHQADFDFNHQSSPVHGGFRVVGLL
jgi:hypothetical protein